MVYNVYGHTNGHTEALQAQKTDRIIQAALRDRELTGMAPSVIAGDLNAEVHDLPAVHNALQVAGWVDAAAHPCATKGRDGTPLGTCQANGSIKWNRRDYLLLTPDLAGKLGGVGWTEEHLTRRTNHWLPGCGRAGC